MEIFNYNREGLIINNNLLLNYLLLNSYLKSTYLYLENTFRVYENFVTSTHGLRLTLITATKILPAISFMNNILH